VTDRWTDSWTDGWKDRQILDRWMDRQTSGAYIPNPQHVPPRSRFELLTNS